MIRDFRELWGNFSQTEAVRPKKKSGEYFKIVKNSPGFLQAGRFCTKIPFIRKKLFVSK